MGIGETHEEAGASCGARWIPLLLIAAGAATAAEGGGPADLVLTAQLDSVSHVLYEPVVVTYQLTNPTRERIETEFRGMHLVHRSIQFEIQCEGGERRDFYSGVLVCGVGSERVMHEPGEVLVGSTSMVVNDVTHALAFPAVGACTLWARMFLGNLPGPIYVEAAPLPVDVGAPRPEDEEVMEQVGGKDRLVGLFERGPAWWCEGSVPGGCFDDLRRIATRFPSSAYASHILLSFGSASAWEWLRNAPHGQLRVDVLSGYVARWPDDRLAPNAMALLIDGLSAVGRAKEAEQWTERFRARYPQRILLLRAQGSD